MEMPLAVTSLILTIIETLSHSRTLANGNGKSTYPAQDSVVISRLKTRMSAP